MLLTLSDAVATQLAQEQARTPQLECSWTAAWDPTTRTVTAPQIEGVGSRQLGISVRDLLTDARPIWIHSHPDVPGWDDLLQPSDKDVEVASQLAVFGHALAIWTGRRAHELLLLRWPRPTPPSERARVRSLRLGPWQLLLLRAW